MEQNDQIHSSNTPPLLCKHSNKDDRKLYVLSHSTECCIPTYKLHGSASVAELPVEKYHFSLFIFACTTYSGVLEMTVLG
jgi:hypothetical protein